MVKRNNLSLREYMYDFTLNCFTGLNYIAAESQKNKLGLVRFGKTKGIKFFKHINSLQKPFSKTYNENMKKINLIALAFLRVPCLTRYLRTYAETSLIKILISLKPLSPSKLPEGILIEYLFVFLVWVLFSVLVFWITPLDSFFWCWCFQVLVLNHPLDGSQFQIAHRWIVRQKFQKNVSYVEDSGMLF